MKLFFNFSILLKSQSPPTGRLRKAFSTLFVILDTTLTQELIAEGFAREFVSKVQQLRKRKDYQVADKIHIVYDGDEEVASAVEAFADYISKETLALSIQRVQDPKLERQNLNDHLTGLDTRLAE